VPDPADDPELLDFAAKLFNLARAGDARALAAYVDAGVPANLSNDKGDTLLMLTAYHGHAEAVRALLERGRPGARAARSAGLANPTEQLPPGRLQRAAEPGVLRQFPLHRHQHELLGHIHHPGPDVRLDAAAFP